MTRSADALELRHTREEEWNGGQTTSRGNHHFIGTPPPPAYTIGNGGLAFGMCGPTGCLQPLLPSKSESYRVRVTESASRPLSGFW
jgi:hypothetical protein